MTAANAASVTAPGTIPALVRSAAAQYADAEAVADGDRRVSFAELAVLTRRAAADCIRRGVQPGDRVGIWAPNSLEWVVAALGALSAGAALVPLNTRFKAGEAAWILDRSRTVLTFVSPPFLGNDYPAMLAGRDGVVVLDESLWRDDLGDADAAEVDRRIEAITPDDTGDVIFTSGTTGRPKGVVTTHAQTLRVFDTWSDVVGLRAGDRYLVVNPFFHTFGYKAGIIACLLRGATIVPQPVFDVPAVLELIERERISVLPGPPTLHQSILDAPDRESRDLSSLRLIVTGAAVVPVTLVERLRDDLKVETVLTAYGLTEATGTVTMCRRGDDPETIATTSGRAIPDTEVRVVDADGNPVATGEPGEVVVRGYNVMASYFEDPEATAEAIDAAGWLHTGDIGVLDEPGNLRITDRLKDMYVVGGFNAYPAEIEQMLAAHPGIAESAVVGVPDERLGEVGKAFVVARPGAVIDPAEIVAWCRERMANYKAPRTVHVVDALPRNASGKVLKFELRRSAATLSSENRS
jgi:acyl-CoA synthetase (AMP-forming)/AMP-acid ligase II